MIRLVLKKTDYLNWLDDGSVTAEARIENVNELLSVAKEFTNLAEFLEEVALVSGADASADGDAVTLMTIHAAKGLEFPVVFMVGMEEGIFPLARASFDASELEEERRLAYVGMTRAREELILTAARERLLYGNYQTNLPSRFLGDIDAEFDTLSSHPELVSGSHYGLKIPKQVRDDISGLTRPDATEPHFVPDDIELVIGDKVSHKIFGTGFVEQIEGQVVSVRFPTGLKKLNIAFAPLEKL
jgi:DNA helicase-2/ATP-dependent DNA helicase PcrA